MRLDIHAARSNGGCRPPDVAAEGAMVAGVAVVLEVGAALSLSTSAALVAGLSATAHSSWCWWWLVAD